MRDMLRFLLLSVVIQLSFRSFDNVRGVWALRSEVISNAIVATHNGKRVEPSTFVHGIRPVSNSLVTLDIAALHLVQNPWQVLLLELI